MFELGPYVIRILYFVAQYCKLRIVNVNTQMVQYVKELGVQILRVDMIPH